MAFAIMAIDCPSFEKASKYGDDKDLFYYFSDVYNKQKNFNSAAGSKVVRVCDFNTDALKRLNKMYPDMSVTPDSDDLIRSADADVVAIATPVYTLTNTTLNQYNVQDITTTIYFLYELGVRSFACNSLIYLARHLKSPKPSP
jgi:hypothetical protein